MPRGLPTGAMPAAAWVAQEQGRHLCQCGCGQPIVIKPRHRQPSRGGIPRFIRGHADRDLASQRQHVAAANPLWKGGRIRQSAGYFMILSPGHPYATKGGYVLEHRLVLERHLRVQQPDSPYLIEVDGVLYLRPGIIVHHADGHKDNNDVANLLPLTPGEHTVLHNPRKGHKKR